VRRGRTVRISARPLLRFGRVAAVGVALLSGCGGPIPTTPMESPSPPAFCAPLPAGSYARAVTDAWIPGCSLAQNIYNDPTQALGPPDAAGSGPDHFSGFVSLGFGGFITLDMGGCVAAGTTAVRVWQVVGEEGVTLYGATRPEGPYTLIAARRPCGHAPGAGRPKIWRYCDFDLAEGGLSAARYLKVEDGELWACPGGTVTEGPDIDAVEVISTRDICTDSPAFCPPPHATGSL